MEDAATIDALRRHAIPVDLDTAAGRVLELIDPAASVLLIGEATHDTLEFYRIRADLTRALVRRRGFDVVAVEADLWRNREVVRFLRWLRSENAERRYQTIRESIDRRIYVGPGELVDVGGHWLHLNCAGSGTPAVILESGLGEAGAY